MLNPDLKSTPIESVSTKTNLYCPYCDGSGDVHTPTGEWRGECICSDAMYNKLDRFLRNNLSDEDYAEYSAALEVVYSIPKQEKKGGFQDLVTKALTRAWQLGQTYWQQADSESPRQNQKADGTRDLFKLLVQETLENANDIH